MLQSERGIGTITTIHKGMVNTKTHTVVTSILVTTTESRAITTRALTTVKIKTIMFKVTQRSLRTIVSIASSETANSYSSARRIKAPSVASLDQGVTLNSEAGMITQARTTSRRKRAKVKTKNQKRCTSSLRRTFLKARKKSLRRRIVEPT